MSGIQSHLTALEASSKAFSSSPLLKLPRMSTNGQVESWCSISYQQFRLDVEHFARYYAGLLSGGGIGGIPPRSVIGLWLGGMTYTDLLHIYGVSRAGYVPQLFSIRLPSPEVVFELIQKAGAKALIFDSSFTSILSGCPVPSHLATDASNVDVSDVSLPSLPRNLNGEDVAFVFHTSGSTSGSPKLVPCNYRWLAATLQKSKLITKPKSTNRHDVSVWMGSMCHIAQSFMFLGTLQNGSSVIQPTKLNFSSEELVDMINRCGLNRLNQFATFLGIHLRNSRSDPKLLSLLQNMDEIVYSGLALPREEEEWAIRNGMNLRSLFGNTECSAMLLSVGGKGRDATFLRPVEGTDYGFFPITPANASESGHQTNTKMVELVILSSSGDCPDVSLRSEDGHFHTGDLFQEVAPGSYISRGRNDDWIKSENSLRCDTRAIEDNVRATCGNLISDCIVVGSGRPSPALFIEPSVDTDHEKLRKEIIRKTRHFHSRRYLHERITSPDLIIIVPPKTLPRTATKGNIRRQAVEEMYKIQLDRIYGATA